MDRIKTRPVNPILYILLIHVNFGTPPFDTGAVDG